MQTIRLVVLDLDNTLYDWVGFYIPSFLAMVRELSRISGIGPAELKASFKKVHERHRSSEYAFAIEELDVLKKESRDLSTTNVFERYGTAIEAFRETRGNTLHLYDGVLETLKLLKAANKKLAAVTDATMFYALRRIKDLGIEDLFDLICAPADHGLPPRVRAQDARRSLDPLRYQSTIPIQLDLDKAIRKPDPAILRAILATMETAPEEALLVGDSLTRDIKMAQRCRVWDVHAQYGARVDPRFFHELLQITYWTDHDVAEDQKLRQEGVNPTFTIDSPSELLQIIKKIEAQSQNRFLT
jgi:phosphoglycolate phosphatase